MKKINLILLLFLSMSLFVFNSCDDDESEFVYVTFAEPEYSKGVDVGGTESFNITVYTGANVGSDTSFNIAIDPSSDAAAGSYEIPTSVTVPSGSNEGTFTVNLSDVNLGIGINNLVLNFDALRNYFDGGSTTISYVQNCTEVTATLDFNFDFYSEETTWEVRDALDGVVASKGGYVNGQWTASETITLCSGRDYTLIVYDAFSDGMNDGTNLGDYTLTINGVVKVTGGGNFGASESNSFDTN